LMSKLHDRQADAVRDASAHVQSTEATSADSLPKRAAMPSRVPAFRVGFGSRVGRVASVGMGLVGVALLALLFVGMSALLQSRQTRGVGPVGPTDPGQPTVTSTPEGIDIGGAYMLDPQGDVELAKSVIETVVESGTPQVVLSRRVVGGDLPCLGFDWQHAHEMRPTDSFGLLVLEGTLRSLFPGGEVPMPPPPNASSESYVQFLRDERYPGPGISAMGPVYWGPLRAAFGGSDWPQDSPMYLSPDGQPGLAEIEQWQINPDFKFTDVSVAQTLRGWTIAVSRVYALADTIVVAYTIVGPNPRDRFTLEQPLLEVEGLSVPGAGGRLQGETMGPSVEGASFTGLPSSLQPREVSMRFVVPAIHVRPPKYPCEVRNLKPEDYPTPTRIPSDPPVGDAGVAPLPDLETVGPFTLDLKVVVEPMPTQPVLPPPPQPSLAVPDIPPVPTAPVDATQAAIASMTVIPVPTQVPGLQATLVARATTSPYPTAGTHTVQVGRPSIAVARRGNLLMEVQLDDNNYLAGENGRALITLRNEGQDALYIYGRRLMLADEAGQEYHTPWPVQAWMPDGWDRGPLGHFELAPGEVETDTLTFQVPGFDETTGRAFHLTAAVQFGRFWSDLRGTDGVPLDLQAGPLPLQPIEPQARQRLKADLQLDRQGWSLRVTDGEGRAPTGPFWGGWEAHYDMGGTSSLLPEPSQAGGGPELPTWSVPWHEGPAEIIRGGSEVTMHLWVAARGYVPAVVTGTLPSALPTGVPGAVGGPTPRPTVGSAPPGPVAEEYRVVHEQDFGIWRYAATESAIEPLHATVNYKHTSVADLFSYRDANRKLAQQLAVDGGDVRVSITLRQSSPAKQLIQQYCRAVWSMQRDAGGTVVKGPRAGGPLSSSEVDAFLDPADHPGFSDGAGIFGINCVVDSRHLQALADEPMVFLVDVTPTWVRRELARAGIAVADQVPVVVDFAFGWMAQLGMVPTIPPPVGTTTPKVLPSAP
jgi:hypothetical protein